MSKAKKIKSKTSSKTATKAVAQSSNGPIAPKQSFTKAIERQMTCWSLPALQFATDRADRALFPASMQQAYQLASTLLASKRFQFHFKLLFVALHPSSAAAYADNKARAFLNQRFTIRLVTDVEDLASLSCAHPAADATAILLHPMLLLNMIRGERSDPQLTSTFALFLAQRLMHEVSHLLHFHLISANKAIAPKGITPTKHFIDDVMVMVNGCESMESQLVAYNDFGIMLERSMGGIFENKVDEDQQHVFMGITAIVAYQSTVSRVGNLVNVEETIANILQHREVPPVLGERFVSVPRHTLSWSSAEEDEETGSGSRPFRT